MATMWKFSFTFSFVVMTNALLQLSMRNFWCYTSCCIRIQGENCRYFHLHNSFWQDSNCLFMSVYMFGLLHGRCLAIQMNCLKMTM